MPTAKAYMTAVVNSTPAVADLYTNFFLFTATIGFL